MYRAYCEGCGRPPIVCICAHLVTVKTRTRVVVLQHPREAGNPIGTAWMVERCLGAQRIVGVELENDPAFVEAVSGAAILLAPGPSAIDLRRDPPSAPVTLIVVDGTWPQARKLLRTNPTLARLPRYAFEPSAPSRYRIRREPAAHCVSTIEATVAALTCLEDLDAARVLAPFEAMVEHQVRIADEQRNNRHLKAAIARQAQRPPRVKRPPLEGRELVVAYCEANAWPRGSEHGPHPELVHAVAERVSTGERFEAYVAPSRPLSPGFTCHTQIPAERVLAGESRESFRQRFAAFLREGDALAVWGSFTLVMFRGEGFEPSVELRARAMAHLGRRAGDVDEMATALGAPPIASWAPYRTGARHGAALSVARALAGQSAQLRM